MHKSAYLFLMAALLSAGCTNIKMDDLKEPVHHALAVARVQSMSMAATLAEQDDRLPRSIGPDGKLETCASDNWVSGFFPGVLWYLYEEYETDEIRAYAEEFTRRVADQQHATDNHDVGFRIFCSFGNGFRLTLNTEYLNVMEKACQSLSTRFDEQIGCIRSWDWGKDMWNYPVIVDNMMNLELLMWGSRAFGNERFEKIAVRHADTTLKNHFREDGSSYHVVSYNDDGSIELKRTWQGHSDDSAWARGQGWGLYGYTMMYRFTKDQDYLDRAVKIAGFIINHPNLPSDGIPYWDFDAPNIPDALRDSSAAALICSALLELSGYVDEPLAQKYMLLAKRQIKTLCSPEYLAEPGANGNFILMHGVGNIPDNKEIDVPLTYADYYFVEALLRYKKIKGF
jgi:rhamnogalacturonyl hydrolase YesR